MPRHRPPRTDHTRAAHDGIRRLLFLNKIVPGQKFSYRMIAEKLGMSLTPVVQALKILEFQGLVKHTPNKGFHAVPLSVQEIREIYELREVLELSLLPHVLDNLDVDGIESLQRVLEKNVTEGLDLNTRLKMDREFHTTLAGISQRKIQTQMLDNLFDLLYIKYRASLLFVTSETVVGSQHRKIFDAVVSRDLHRMETTLKHHFTLIKSRALSTLTRMLAENPVAP